MDIVHQKWEFLNSLLPEVPLQRRTLFQFGVTVLALREIISLRANARIPSLKWNTAKSKIYRLTANTRMPQVFLRLLLHLGIVGARDILAVDFSDFGNDFQVLMFAKQTKKGRAVPVYFEILRYPIDTGSQTRFTIDAIKHLTQLIGFKPTLVFDRGFMSPWIVRFLAKNQHPFVLRIKAGKKVRFEKTLIAACAVPDADARITAYTRRLRLVRSDAAAHAEPWYLLTNITTKTRNRIIDIYFHRFEIEEFFRDAKHILGLEYVHVNTDLTLSVTLWFAILGTWFLWSLEQHITRLQKKTRQKMQLSVPRFWFEQLLFATIRTAEKNFLPNSS